MGIPTPSHPASPGPPEQGIKALFCPPAEGSGEGGGGERRREGPREAREQNPRSYTKPGNECRCSIVEKV